MADAQEHFPGDLPSGFRDLVGYRLVEWRDGFARLELALTPQHMNRSGVIHGGVLTTMMDAAGGYAGSWCAVEGNVRRCVTVSLDSKFMGQVDRGTITVTARRRGGGQRIFFASVEVSDEAGEILAIGDGVYRLRRGSETVDGSPLDT